MTENNDNDKQDWVDMDYGIEDSAYSEEEIKDYLYEMYKQREFEELDVDGKLEKIDEWLHQNPNVLDIEETDTLMQHISQGLTTISECDLSEEQTKQFKKLHKQAIKAVIHAYKNAALRIDTQYKMMLDELDKLGVEIETVINEEVEKRKGKSHPKSTLPRIYNILKERANDWKSTSTDD